MIKATCMSGQVVNAVPRADTERGTVIRDATEQKAEIETEERPPKGLQKVRLTLDEKLTTFAAIVER